MKFELNMNKKQLVKVTLFVAVFAIFVSYYLQNSRTASYTVGLFENQPPYPNSVNCVLVMSSITDFNDRKLKSKVEIDEEPVAISIYDIDTGNPTMIGNTGNVVSLTQTNNASGNVAYFQEVTNLGDLNVYTLFRDKNILMITKQYDLIGTPFGLIWSGYCL